MTEIKMPSKKDIARLIGRKVVKVKYYPDFLFTLKLYFDDGTILKIVFGIDSGFVELKMAKTKEGDSDGTN